MKQSEILKRRNRISEYIQIHKSLSTIHACQLFHVSDETIRKDFEYLDEMHIVKKMYGGAKLYINDETKPFNIRKDEHYLAKIAIAQRAAEMIPESGGFSIGLDMGTTFSILAGYLAQRHDNLIITNSNAAMQQLIDSPNRVYVLGGEYDPESRSFQGDIAIRALHQMTLDIAFIGTGGVRSQNGISTARFVDLQLKQEYIRRSQKKVVLTDSSKFTSTSLVEVAGWNEIDTLITDSGIPEETAEKLRNVLELIIVS